MEGFTYWHYTCLSLGCLSFSSHPDPSLGPGCSCMCSVCSGGTYGHFHCQLCTRESQGLRMVLCHRVVPGGQAVPCIHACSQQGPGSVGTGCLRTESPGWKSRGRAPDCRGHGQAPPPGWTLASTAWVISASACGPGGQGAGRDDAAGPRPARPAGPRLPQPCVQPLESPRAQPGPLRSRPFAPGSVKAGLEALWWGQGQPSPLWAPWLYSGWPGRRER